MLAGKTAGSPILARAAATALTAIWLVPAAAAGEFVLSLGADDVSRNSPVVALGAAFHATPLWRIGRADLGLGAAAEIDGDGDVWGGAGLVLTLPLDAGWRLEASFMPGAYSEGSGNDLGTTAPMFRTQLGASVLLASGWRVGAAINHKSNARTASYNPGVETLFLTFGRAF
jgi:hypothetical protein